MQRCPDTQNNIREVKEQKLNEAQTDLEKPHQENGFRNVLYVGGGKHTKSYNFTKTGEHTTQQTTPG